MFDDGGKVWWCEHSDRCDIVEVVTMKANLVEK